MPEELALLRPETTEVRRKSFLLGRQAARQALTSLGQIPAPIPIGSSREPIWPVGVVGSITHTTEFGAAIVAPLKRTDGIGVDLEVRQRASARELDSTVLVPEELEWLAETDGEQRRQTVLRVFSAKECIYKAFFPRVRTFFGFDRATLIPSRSGFTARLSPGLDPDYPPDRTFEVHSSSRRDLVLSWLVLPKTRPVGGP